MLLFLIKEIDLEMKNEIDNDFQVSNCQLQKCDWPGKRQSEIYNDFYLKINKKVMSFLQSMHL